jgi:hypothetical protein
MRQTSTVLKTLKGFGSMTGKEEKHLRGLRKLLLSQRLGGMVIGEEAWRIALLLVQFKKALFTQNPVSDAIQKKVLLIMKTMTDPSKLYGSVNLAIENDIKKLINKKEK